MTREEITNILNKLHLVYKNAFVDVDTRERAEMYIKIYTKQLGDLDFTDVDKAIDYYIQNNDTNFAPSIKTIRDTARSIKNARLNKSGGGMRLQTPEEIIVGMYHDLMKKPNKTDEDFSKLESWKKYVELFEGEGWQERYKQHFGKYREEFEKL